MQRNSETTHKQINTLRRAATLSLLILFHQVAVVVVIVVGFHPVIVQSVAIFSQAEHQIMYGIMFTKCCGIFFVGMWNGMEWR